VYIINNMEKRGQFYLVSAVIIVMVISSLTSVVVYTTEKPKTLAIEDLSSELKEESARVIDYDIYKNDDKLLSDFTKQSTSTSTGTPTDYFLQKSDNANLTLIFGNSNEIKVFRYYPEENGVISFGGASWAGSGWTPIQDAEKIDPRMTDTNEIQIKLLNKDYSFKKRDNKMFYFVLSKEKQGEMFIETNNEDDKKPEEGTFSNLKMGIKNKDEKTKN
jgi:hypothetical protein